MVPGHLRSRGLQAISHAAYRSRIAAGRPLPTVAGGRRLLSSPQTGAAAAGGNPQSQLHRGKKAEEEERRLWPYIKAAKQQFFNVVLSTLAIVMAVKMVEGKGARVALEEEIAELERREGVLLRALSDEAWAEDVANRVGAVGGKDAILSEIGEVVKSSMLDKESAELQAMRAAALKAAQEAESGGPAAVKDGVEGMFAPGTTGEPQKGGASSKPASSSGMM